MSALEKLIKDASVDRSVALPAAVVKDLKLVLANNDVLTNRLARVSVKAFMDYCQKEYKANFGRHVLLRFVTSTLGRKSWAAK